MDWNHVRVFLAVAESGGLGRAAVALGLSEATVGRQVAALERALNSRLFERLANRVELTPVGRQLAEAAGAMAEGAAGIERLAAVAAAEPGMPVRVTATTSVALFLTLHLGRLLAAAGTAPLELINTRAPQSLPQREAEIALRMRRPPERGDLLARRVGRLAFAVYARESGADAAWIGLRPDPASRQSRWLDEQAGSDGVRLRLAELPLRLLAVRQGLGRTLLPCFLGDAEPGLVRIGAPPPELAEEIHLLIHADLRGLPQVRMVAEALALLLREQAGVLAGQAQAASSPSSGRAG